METIQVIVNYQSHRPVSLEIFLTYLITVFLFKVLAIVRRAPTISNPIPPTATIRIRATQHQRAVAHQVVTHQAAQRLTIAAPLVSMPQQPLSCPHWAVVIRQPLGIHR